MGLLSGENCMILTSICYRSSVRHTWGSVKNGWSYDHAIFSRLLPYLSSFSRCCLPNLRNHAKFWERSNICDFLL